MNTADSRETSKTQNDKSVDSASNDILNKYTQYVVAEQLKSTNQQNQKSKQNPPGVGAAQKQYQDLFGNEIYEKRPFENQAKCYFCS